MSSHRRNQTHRQIPREIEAGVPENRSQKKQSAPQKPTDPWVFGYGKPPWKTAAETLWETEVWCLLCARMLFRATRQRRERQRENDESQWDDREVA